MRRMTDQRPLSDIRERDHSEPGQIVVSDVVRQLAMGKGFLFGDIGEVVPKGFEEPVRLYECYYQSEDAAED